MNIKYTQEQEEELKADYAAISMLSEVSILEKHDLREKFILVYMHKHDKSKRSVIAKLSKMKDNKGNPLYIARPKVSKVTNEKAQTKDQMVNSLTTSLGFSPNELEGLDKTPKLVLVKLVKRNQEIIAELEELRKLI